MSLRLQMLQVARLAPKLLGDSAALVRDFTISQQNEDGGFRDRSGRSDLYYTVFGLETIAALQAAIPLERTLHYLQGFGSGEHLDFVHVCCLARAWAGAIYLVSQTQPENRQRAEEQFLEIQPRLLARVEQHRSKEGGFNVSPGSERGSVYACFLALGACQDCGKMDVNGPGILRCLAGLGLDDGSWSNLPKMTAGSTNATSAAVAIRQSLAQPLDVATSRWLLAQAHPQGGFLAAPEAPMPDLLSTATALHALAALEADVAAIKEDCLDFIDSLWTNEGGFHGHWADDILDCEYTYYGLLALGHLSL